MHRLKSAEWRFLYLGPPIGILIVISLLLFGWWLSDRRYPLEELTGTFVGWDEKIPRRGHVIWTGIPVRSCPGTVYRYIVDGEIVILPSKKLEYQGPIENPSRDIRVIPTSFDLPERIKHDASYKIIIVYECNKLQEYAPIRLTPPAVPFKLAPYMENDGIVPEKNDDIDVPEINP